MARGARSDAKRGRWRSGAGSARTASLVPDSSESVNNIRAAERGSATVDASRRRRVDSARWPDTAPSRAAGLPVDRSSGSTSACDKAPIIYIMSTLRRVGAVEPASVAPAARSAMESPCEAQERPVASACATRTDCLRASAANSGVRTSGTQTCSGRSPRSRIRRRYQRLRIARAIRFARAIRSRFRDSAPEMPFCTPLDRLMRVQNATRGAEPRTHARAPTESGIDRRAPAPSRWQDRR